MSEPLSKRDVLIAGAGNAALCAAIISQFNAAVRPGTFDHTVHDNWRTEGQEKDSLAHNSARIMKACAGSGFLKPPPRVYNENEGDEAHENDDERHPIPLNPIFPRFWRLTRLDADRDQK